MSVPTWDIPARPRRPYRQPMEMGLEGRRAVITGASKGIGRRVALALAAEGVHLVLAARELGPLQGVAMLAAAHGVNVDSVSADLSTATGVAAVADLAVDREVDIVVNNVGLSEPTRMSELTDDDWARCFQANFFSAVRLSTACLPGMQTRRWGRIVNVASIVAREPDPWFAHYSAAKAALVSYSKALSREFSKDGVMTNCILPGIVRTESTDELAQQAAGASGRTTEEIMARMLERKPVPAARLGDPDDVAALVVFLASERASWLSGAGIAIDGGTLAGVW